MNMMTSTMMKIIELDNKAVASVSNHTVPSPQAGEVLIKVAYSALDTAFEEVAHRKFIPGSLLHDLKVKPLVAGWHFSGKVLSLGAGASDPSVADEPAAAADDNNDNHDLKVGDLVFGHLQYSSSTKQGTLAEYVTVPALECAKVPSGVALDIASAVTTEALTALQAMRDLGGLSEGKKVLVIGGGGGVGSQAIQIAKAMKASTVHGVCSTRDVSKVQALGADLVLDRTQLNITKDLDAASYDVIFDTTGKYSFTSLRYALRKKGALVNTIPGVVTSFFSWLIPIIYNKQYKSVFVVCNRVDLELVGSWLQKGELSCPIDSLHNIKDFENAAERQKDPKKSGRVVIKVEDGW